MTVQEVRLAKLKVYLRDECGGNKSLLARRLQRKQSFVSELLRGKRSFGEKLARDIERRLDMLPLDLDQPVVSDMKLRKKPATTAEAIGSRARDLDKSTQELLLMLIEIIAAGNPKARHYKDDNKHVSRTKSAA